MYTQLTLATALAIGAPALKEKEPLGTGPGYLGITFTQDAAGLQVTDVIADGPADKAGLKPGDVMVKLDDTDLSDAETGDLVKRVAAMRPGMVVAIAVRRGAEAKTIKVKLGPRPADFQQPRQIPPPPIDP